MFQTPSPMSYLKHTFVLFLLLSLALLPGCSVKLLYNHLDWIIANRVDDLIVLNDDQAANLEQRVDYLLAWHRKTQLGAYHDTLDAVIDRVENGVEEQDVVFTLLAVEGHWHVLKERASPAIAQSLLMLSPAQRNELFVNLEERNREYREEYVDRPETEQVETRRDRLQEAFEHWVGYANEQQLNVFAYYAEQFQTIHPLRLEYRRDWQQRLRRILDSSAPDEEKLTQLNTLLRNPRLFRPADYAQALEHNKRLAVEMIVLLDRTLSAEQRRQFTQTLREYQQLVTELGPSKAS